VAYTIEWDSHAARAFDKLPRDAQHAIATKVRLLATDPRPRGSRKLQGSEDVYRVRAGDFRVLYQVLDDVLLVLVIEVGPRKSIYRSR
jgi:mRNA interferase RelE/StbE